MLSALGSGTSTSPQPCSPNSAVRPARTASRSFSSGKCEKNCHGVRAPHSSPMNSIGVNGPLSSSAAPQASRPGERVSVSRSPMARLPIWSWFCRKATNRWPGVRWVSTGAPWLRCRKLDQVPSCRNARQNTWASPVSPAAAKSA